jgi:hypothetical protein
VNAESDELRERVIADLQVLKRIGGDALIVGILASVLPTSTRPLKRGRTKVVSYYDASAPVVDRPAEPERKARRRSRRGDEGKTYGL